jgi:hypothetical protein
MDHTPQEMLNFVWTFEIPDFVPNQIVCSCTPSLLTISHCSSNDIIPANFIEEKEN